ncbi:nuclear transport factor 2 family protein [Mycobacterium koreense]|uniref:Bile acid 7-alpha dehydratase n=1 Tax=Mycolicibacillus koreensis TaxID=1069220 RepID=A0A7I7SFB6_9MYCO|nr:nuclear transport factor 2 family protein [Mycolicibacillus koreensis]MCV7248165.1 nuclear transport factor 2 family protein [Mycolicibacillus koreensis]ODR08061.1 bile acid 7-alpha dehydratase [Mycolicibacillus koreensis]OSC35724.1 bile acid 7-alpha dehydratase [Mycolicibacillus koreensis]BBY55101.1 hypothetical protein MKOR_23520 [Mycolicibacillus koreensis]
MNIENRLDALEQIEAIKALKHRYFRACDAKDAATFRDCFCADGARLDYGALGTFDSADHLAAIFRRIAGHTVDGKPAVLDMHHGIHPDITVLAPDRAKGRWTLKFRQLNLIENTEKILTGDYDDEYVLEDGRWKIAASRFDALWSLTRPLTDTEVEWLR